MAPPMVQLYHNRNVNKNSLLFKVDYTSLLRRKGNHRYSFCRKSSSRYRETKNAKDATATEKGYTGDKVCKVCGYTVKGKEIPVSGTTKPTNPTKPDGNTDVTSPKTGDNSNLAGLPYCSFPVAV